VRVVLDTGVLISGLIRPHGTPGQILERLRSGYIQVVYSIPILLEVIDVLGRPRLRRKYGIQVEDAAALINLIRLRGDLVSPNQQLVDICRDPRDNKFLDVALSGQVEAIVSGDQDLLALHPFQGIPILSPKSFLDLLAGHS
jgi:putative PIN family toxin of toxin-antitoxin system